MTINLKWLCQGLELPIYKPTIKENTMTDTNTPDSIIPPVPGDFVVTPTPVTLQTGGTDINSLLAEREKQYGSFTGYSYIANNLKNALRQGTMNGWDELSADKKEALDMIACKIARILNGNPDNLNSWEDICGYSQLVIRNLTR